MALNYDNIRREINVYDEGSRDSAIGYFDKLGHFIDYSHPEGESGHDGWSNDTSNLFLDYINFIVTNEKFNIDCSNVDIMKEDNLLQYKNVEDWLIRGVGWYVDKNEHSKEEMIEKLKELLKYYEKKEYPDYRLRKDIVLFMLNAYSTDNFFKAIDKQISVMDWRTFYKGDIDIGSTYDHDMYIIRTLLSNFKEIAVQYLGYDALERFSPTGERIELCGTYLPWCWKDKSELYESYFENTPRIITTSRSLIDAYERYYNLLLFDWNIHQVPRYLWNGKKYEEYPHVVDFYYQEELEEKKETIANIKKLVPKKERYKYFREPNIFKV